MKKRNIVLLLLVVLVIIVLASCFGKKALTPGKYEVTQAVHEIKDDDYELQVKNYGEYDVDKLEVVKDASIATMTLEIKEDKSHILYVKSEEDVIIDNSTDSSTKTKKKKKR